MVVLVSQSHNFLKVCEGCPQNWENKCRAYAMALSKEEREHRMQGEPMMNCQPTQKRR